MKNGEKEELGEKKAGFGAEGNGLQASYYFFDGIVCFNIFFLIFLSGLLR